MRRPIAAALAGFMLLSLYACVPTADEHDAPSSVTIGDTDSPTSSGRDVLLKPTAPGTAQRSVPGATIDYSNANSGYVMCKRGDIDSSTRMKVIIQPPEGEEYRYDLYNDWQVFLLPESGTYRVTCYRNVGGDEYTAVTSADFTASLTDPLLPFLYPNCYVDWYSAPNTVQLAQELTLHCEDDLAKIVAIYDYVVDNFTYDDAKAATVPSGYVPVIDDVLESGTGICFDYAAVMAGMLRGIDIPCKLVIGNTGRVYHAWISVYTDEAGWIDNFVQFNGTEWHRMDPTYAAAGRADPDMAAFITDDANYSERYCY